MSARRAEKNVLGGHSRADFDDFGSVIPLNVGAKRRENVLGVHSRADFGDFGSVIPLDVGAKRREKFFGGAFPILL